VSYARRQLACAALAAVLTGCLRAHIVSCDVSPCGDAAIEPPDAGMNARDAGSDGGADAGSDGGTDAGSDGGADAGPDLCEGTVLCDHFDDESLATGLAVVGNDSPSWTIVNVGADSWRESASEMGVLESGPGLSGSWWGNTCGGVPPVGPAILVAPPFDVSAAAGFSIDFDYFQTDASCSHGIVGVGLAAPEPALSWDVPPPHFGGDVWFLAMAGVGVELRSGTEPVFDTGVVGFPAAGAWYHFHVEVCADGAFEVSLTDLASLDTVASNRRISPDARLALSTRAALRTFVFAEGAGKRFDNLRVVPGCSL
jgi:hypothetical protein